VWLHGDLYGMNILVHDGQNPILEELGWRTYRAVLSDR
jgi:hypothetical protein